MAELKGIEVFDVGTWVGSRGPMKWTIEDMRDIVANTGALINEGKLKPKLKFGHDPKQKLASNDLFSQKDGKPSLGRATNFRLKGTKVICDFVDVPDVVHKAIGGKLYTNVSSEVEFIKNFGWFISAVALLGADTPAVKTLSDLEAFFSDSINNSSGDRVVLTFTEPNIKGDHAMPEENGKTVDPTVQALLDANKKLMDENKLQADAIASLTSEFSEFKKSAEGKDKELEDLRTKTASQQFTDGMEKVLAPYKKDVEAKKLPPAVLDEIKSHLESQKAGFTEGGSLSVSAELAHKIAQSYTNLPDGESMHSKGGDEDSKLSADEKLEAEVLKVQSKNSALTYSEAADFVFKTQPELAQEYTEWTDSVSAIGKAGGV